MAGLYARGAEKSQATSIPLPIATIAIAHRIHPGRSSASRSGSEMIAMQTPESEMP